MSQANLKIYTGNRPEALTEHPAGITRSPLPSPLTPEIIVVQSRCMERWISPALAELTGVSANRQFPFFDLCFRGLDPIDDNFETMVRRVFQPMLSHVSEIKQ